MKACVLHVNTSRATATTPTMRICRFIADTLGLPLVYDVPSGDAALAQGPFDVVFFKPGILKFSNHREQALKLCGEARMLVVVENDYAFPPDPRFVKLGVPMHPWTTVRANVKTRLSLEMNWNVLTWDYGAPAKPRQETTDQNIKPELFYWGAYRLNRVDEFRAFFENTQYQVTIGTNPLNMKKFSALLPSPYVTTFNLRPPQSDVLRQYAATVYIEDTHSRDNFCQLANRFYEAMEAGVLTLISERSISTFEQAGFSMDAISPFVVSDSTDVARALRQRAKLHQLQKAWHVDYVEPVRQRLAQAGGQLSRFIARRATS